MNQRNEESRGMRKGTKIHKEASITEASIEKHGFQLSKLHVFTNQAEHKPHLISVFGC